MKKILVMQGYWVEPARLMLLSISLFFSTAVLSDTYFVVFNDESMTMQEMDPDVKNPIKRMRSGESIQEVSERLFKEVGLHQRLLKKQRGTPNNVQTENRFKKSYHRAIQGFSAELTDDAVIYLRHSPEVKYVAKDVGGSGNAAQSPTPSWGLDRIDQSDTQLDSTYEYFFDGANVHAYILDSGIRLTHNEFVGRIGNGFDSQDNDFNPTDCNGHGTHVAGTVGGENYGVAKNVIIHPVRVLDCQGNFSSAQFVIDGIEWVLNNLQVPAVANMSLSTYSPFQPLDDAVDNLINAGVTTVVSAMNNNQDACTDGSPTAVANAITVGATTSSDRRSSFSNFGSCLDIFAPGSSIQSSWFTSDTATATLSGTSMAAPHVTGVVAQMLESNPQLTPAAVAHQIVWSATQNTLTDIGSNSPNLMLYTALSLPVVQNFYIDNNTKSLFVEPSTTIGFSQNWDTDTSENMTWDNPEGLETRFEYSIDYGTSGNSALGTDVPWTHFQTFSSGVSAGVIKYKVGTMTSSLLPHHYYGSSSQYYDSNNYAKLSYRMRFEDGGEVGEWRYLRPIWVYYMN